MYKATIGQFYDVDKNTLSHRYYMSEDTKERLVIRVNDSIMVDIDNYEFYSIVKRDERGYLEGDIKLNEEYVISYEPVKKNNYETYKKCAIAKIYAFIYNHYERVLKSVSKQIEKEKAKKLVKEH